MLGNVTFDRQSNARVSGHTRRIIYVDGRPAFREVEYKIPMPGYIAQGCGASIGGADPVDVLKGCFASALENDLFCDLLDRLYDGLGQRIRWDYEASVDCFGQAGRELKSVLTGIHRQELIPALIRATEVRSPKQVELLVKAWSSPRKSRDLADLVSQIPALQTTEDHAALTKKLRVYGLSVKIPEALKTQFTARSTLRRLVQMSGG